MNLSEQIRTMTVQDEEIAGLESWPRTKVSLEDKLRCAYQRGFRRGCDAASKLAKTDTTNREVEATTKLISAAASAYEAITRGIMAAKNY